MEAAKSVGLKVTIPAVVLVKLPQFCPPPPFFRAVVVTYVLILSRGKCRRPSSPKIIHCYQGTYSLA
jgi:hypothetical protein